MFKPNYNKFRKSHRGKVSQLVMKNQLIKKNPLIIDINNHPLKNGIILQALEYNRLKNNQINIIFNILKKELKKVLPTKIIINSFPNIPVTKKPAEVRQGQGKGPVEFWINRIRKNKVLLILIPKFKNMTVNNSINKNSNLLFNQEDTNIDTISLLTWKKQVVLILKKINYLLSFKLKIISFTNWYKKNYSSKLSKHISKNLVVKEKKLPFFGSYK